jgi:hypothetical protein
VTSEPDFPINPCFISPNRCTGQSEWREDKHGRPSAQEIATGGLIHIDDYPRKYLVLIIFVIAWQKNQ